MLTGKRGVLPEPLCYRGHIAGLDVLRGAAVLGVILYHAFGFTTDWTGWHGLAAAWIAFTFLGHLGVQLFFVLSGFLITGILLDGKERPVATRARRFYLRRARRILPVYLVMLAVLGLTHQVNRRFLISALFFVVNLGGIIRVQLFQYGVVWSLAVEEQFYLLWPWIAWRCSIRSLMRLILACLVLSPLLRLALALIGQDTYFKTYDNLDYLMDGALVACTLRTGRLHGGNIFAVSRWLYGAGLTGMALWVGMTAVFHSFSAQVLFFSVGGTLYMALFVAWLLSALIAHQPFGRASTGARSPSGRWFSLGGWPAQALVFLGYISYGLYLVHLLIFGLYDRQVAGTTLGDFQKSFALLALRALVCGTISVLLAWMSRSTLEAWFLRRGSEPPNLPPDGQRLTPAQ